MNRNRQVLWALLLIGIGVVLLLRNTGAIEEDVRIWPLVLLVVGGWLLLERLTFGGRLRAGFVAPLVLIAIGGAFFLEDVGALEQTDVVLPLVVIAVGLGLVLASFPARRRVVPTAESVGLEGASEALVRINHGAGHLTIRSHLGGSNLLEGTFHGGADTRTRREGSRLEVALSARPWLPGVPWARGGPFDWSVTLSRQVPVSLELHTGANAAELDLSDLTVPELRIETGASKTQVTLPTSGQTKAFVRGGAADIRVAVPTRVAARIEVRGGLSSVKVDQMRFPRVGDEYRSPDYQEAERRADVVIDAGAANIEVS